MKIGLTKQSKKVRKTVVANRWDFEFSLIWSIQLCRPVTESHSVRVDIRIKNVFSILRCTSIEISAVLSSLSSQNRRNTFPFIIISHTTTIPTRSAPDPLHYFMWYIRYGLICLLNYNSLTTRMSCWNIQDQCWKKGMKLSYLKYFQF